jgi:hypothetical protein
MKPILSAATIVPWLALACRSYILVIRSWSAYDSNQGSARLVTAACSDEDNHDPPLLDPEIKARTVGLGGIEGCVGELGRKQAQAT